MISWYSNSLNELTFTCQTAVVRLELVDANVARVRMEPVGFAFNTNASFTIVKQWARPPISVIDGDPLTVTTPGLRVEVNKNPFRLTFRKPDGTVWLSGASSDGFSAFADDGLTNRGATFQMAGGEQFYGLGLVLGQPLSYRGQIRSLYNDRARFQFGAMTDMAVPLVLSSKGYGLFLDNTYSQLWDFICSDNTQWRATTTGGELDYYFIGANSLADTLDRYTQITVRFAAPAALGARVHAVPLRLSQLVGNVRRPRYLSHQRHALRRNDPRPLLVGTTEPDGRIAVGPDELPGCDCQSRRALGFGHQGHQHS